MTRRIAPDKHGWALPLLVALVIAEVAIFGSFMWITSPQTTFAPGFKEELFRGLKIGTAQTEVTRVLCPPLATREVENRDKTTVARRRAVQLLVLERGGILDGLEVRLDRRVRYCRADVPFDPLKQLVSARDGPVARDQVVHIARVEQDGDVHYSSAAS